MKKLSGRFGSLPAARIAVGCTILLIFCLVVSPAAAVWDGTANDDWYNAGQSSFTLSTEAELAGLAVLVNNGNNFTGKTIFLSAGLDLGGHDWTPIGYDNYENKKPFKGSFDGAGNAITGLNISAAGTFYLGLFGYAEEAEITNISLDIKTITGKNHLGGIVGLSDLSRINNCSVTGDICGNLDVGGIVGASINSTIADCLAAGRVTGLGHAGGIVGTSINSTIANCLAAGRVTGSDCIGGIIGYMDNTSITSSAALNQFVNGSSNLSRITGYREIGYRNVGDISGSYAWDGMTNAGEPLTPEPIPYFNENKGISAPSERLWANLTFYQSVFGADNISTDGNTVWRVSDAGETEAGWPLPYLTAQGAPCGNSNADVLYLKPVKEFAESGTADNPYQIRNEADLRKLAELVNTGRVLYNAANYTLMEDIELSGEWTPIGSNSNHFFGTFDGAGRKITGLNISAIDSDCQGLFGCIERAAIHNVTLTVKDITGRWYAGGITGDSNLSTISSCSVAGNITAFGWSAGGIAGWSADSTINNCSAVCNVSGTKYTGGLAGGSYHSRITNCFTAGTVSGANYTGGITGQASGYSTISNCSAVCSVFGRNYTGGIAGKIYQTRITNSVTAGTVDGAAYVGGFTGAAVVECSIRNSFALNSFVNGSSKVGRFVGSRGNNTIPDCYAWDGMTNAGTLFIVDTAGGNGRSAPSEYLWATPAFYQAVLGADNISTGETTVWRVSDGESYGGWPLPYLAAHGAPCGNSNASVLYLKPVKEFEESGTADDPYQIHDEADLKKLAELVNTGRVLYNAANYTLMQDIELSGEWTPIGSDINPFQGNFEGNNGKITGLSISSADADALGLFGYMERAAISNLSISVDGIRSGGNGIGGLAGATMSCTVSNCSVAIAGSISGGEYVGGLIGVASGRPSVESGIHSCFVTGNVNGSRGVGGLIGVTEEPISNCYAAGNVSGDEFVGGLAGALSSGDVAEAPSNAAAAIINSTALNCFVNGSANVSRVAGNVFAGTLENTYAWEGMILNISGVETLASAGGNNGMSVASLAVWNNETFYKDTLCWDFAGVWRINATNQDYLLPVLHLRPDTAGLTAAYLRPVNITFCGNGNTSGTMQEQIVSPNAKTPLSRNVFIRTGYVFAGWNKTSAAGTAVDVTDGALFSTAADATLYAVWALPGSSGGEDTGSGHYTEYPRTVATDGHISFGTSPVVTGLTLPEGVKGTVTLQTTPDIAPPADKTVAVLFTVSVSLAGTAADGTPLTGKDIPATIEFKLTAEEIEAAGYTIQDVVLYHYKDGAWIPCKTYLKEAKDGTVYFTAETDGFSPFAVVYETNGTNVPAGTETPAATATAAPTEPAETVPAGTAGTPSAAAKTPMPIAAVIAGALAAGLLAGRRG
ncbi:MAG: PGF-pre-PGF domain-containing protein [Methanocorpusculum sp.]|nr:PGF-pre-PGF domain-containing protein [Methanocorpusculum sp.]